ncbi:MAG: glycerol-3-phosphate 1-O-acyltransferase PlsY [Alphaproteobacteria bacterium]|nr:glycerol-3-phosphate 1-O-acyltransferase PlsY [Alphaproteobacteria bacterium]
MQPVFLVLAAIGGYLFGSIPFGLVLTRLAGLGDIRAIGSGNIGATNVLRTGRKDLAAATLLLDAGKAGIAAAVFAALLGTTAGLVAGAAALIGHCFPVWLKFKGGKGVATFLGTLLALFWPAGIAACLTWALIAGVFRISSLSALVAAALSPVWVSVLGMPSAGLATALLAALIFLRHDANIKRLIAGEEPRIGRKG